jgi:hypothetical protein
MLTTKDVSDVEFDTRSTHPILTKLTLKRHKGHDMRLDVPN